MPQREEKDVALVIQSHDSRVAPDWDVSGAVMVGQVGFPLRAPKFFSCNLLNSFR